MKRKKRNRRPQRRFYQINQYIKAAEIRLVDAQGKQIDIMPIQKARILAQQQQLDLVEIGPQAAPPVVKLIDFQKFKYLEAKKQQEQKKKAKKSDSKEVRFTPFIASGDYQARLKKVKEFLKGGYRIKISIIFKGRQLAHKQTGYDLVAKILDDLQTLARRDQDPKFIGRHLITFLTPIK